MRRKSNNQSIPVIKWAVMYARKCFCSNQRLRVAEQRCFDCKEQEQWKESATECLESMRAQQLHLLSVEWLSNREHNEWRTGVVRDFVSAGPKRFGPREAVQNAGLMGTALCCKNKPRSLVHYCCRPKQTYYRTWNSRPSCTIQAKLGSRCDLFIEAFSKNSRLCEDKNTLVHYVSDYWFCAYIHSHVSCRKNINAIETAGSAFFCDGQLES